MAVGADEFALADDGSFILADDGSFGIGPECCCECPECVNADFAEVYAVAFENGVDFDFEGADEGQTCGFTNAPFHGLGLAWDYTVNGRWEFEGYHCNNSIYGYALASPNDIYAAEQTNGKCILLACFALADPFLSCPRWMIQVDQYYCSGGEWLLNRVFYSRGSNGTPVGIYTYVGTSPYLPFNYTEITGFTRPDSIVIS